MQIKFNDDKLKHSLNVARKCYEIAKNKYQKDEDFARKMWLIGYCHDIGYEFATNENPHEHPWIGSDIIRMAFGSSCKPIMEHGKRVPQTMDELRILNEADLRVDRKGNIVSVENRLSDIAIKHGYSSPQYVNAHWLAKELGLIEDTDMN